MRSVDDQTIFHWIANHRTPIPDSSNVNATCGVPLSCLIPLRFERYAKILHRFDGHYENIDHPLTAEEISILNLPDCTVVRELVIEQRISSRAPRILWKDAAHAFGLPYAPELNRSWFSRQLDPYPDCWPRFIDGPASGTLDSDECYQLVSTLKDIAGQQECYFRLAAIPFVATDQNLLFTGVLDEVGDFFVNGGFQYTPEYWWPSDCSWCVCSDYDLEFTVVAGPSSLIDLLLKNKILECIEIPPSIRVDYLTPIPQRG